MFFPLLFSQHTRQTIMYYENNVQSPIDSYLKSLLHRLCFVNVSDLTFILQRGIYNSIQEIGFFKGW